MTHSLDYSQSAQFIEALTGDQNTPCTWQTFADKKSIFAKPEVIHGSLVRVWPRLKALQNKGQGIFITVQETDLNGREAANITALRACFVDFDPPTINGKKAPFTEQERAAILERLAAAALPPNLTINSGADPRRLSDVRGHQAQARRRHILRS